MARGPEGTIYRDEAGFDDELKIEIDFIQMKFIQELKTLEESSIFYVDYNGEPRVLKVVCSLIWYIWPRISKHSDYNLVP